MDKVLTHFELVNQEVIILNPGFVIPLYSEDNFKLSLGLKDEVPGSLLIKLDMSHQKAQM